MGVVPVRTRSLGGIASAPLAAIAMLALSAFAAQRPPVGAALPIGGASTDATPLPDSDVQDWAGTLERRTLDDGSIISDYIARTASTDRPAATLRTDFVPRFGCAPAIGVRVEGVPSATLASRYGDGDDVILDIDEGSLTLSVLVDADVASTTLWFDGGPERRDALWRALDSGSRARLRLLPAAAKKGEEGETAEREESMSFSLLGSRDSVAVTASACRAHEPLPWDR